MKKVKIDLNNLSYNAYGIIGSAGVADELEQILENEFGIIKSGNPDFFLGNYDNLTIDDARNLKKLHESMPMSSSGKKIFIIVANNINTEAQNALLKLLEEPAPYAHFFIVISQINLLLPTVKSRLHFVENTNYSIGRNLSTDEISSEVKKFLSANKVKKLEIVKKISDDISKDKRSKQYAIDFVNEIQNQICGDRDHVKNLVGQNLANVVQSLEATQIALKYLNDRAPSVKMLLEYVALNVWYSRFN